MSTEFTMGAQTAAALLADKCELLRKLFDECVDISKKSGVIFELPWGGEGTSERGIGGFYNPRSDSDYHHEGWVASSHTC